MTGKAGARGLRPLLCLLLIALTAATPAPKAIATKPDGTLLSGSWAGGGFALGGDEDRITVQSGCTHGRSNGPVYLDKSGGFTAHGYYNPPRTGFRLGDIAPRDRPAVFSGKVNGKTLMLSVAFAGSGTSAPHSLVRGASIRFPHCD